MRVLIFTTGSMLLCFPARVFGTKDWQLPSVVHLISGTGNQANPGQPAKFSSLQHNSK